MYEYPYLVELTLQRVQRATIQIGVPSRLVSGIDDGIWHHPDIVARVRDLVASVCDLDELMDQALADSDGDDQTVTIERVIDGYGRPAFVLAVPGMREWEV